MLSPPRPKRMNYLDRPPVSETPFIRRVVPRDSQSTSSAALNDDEALALKLRHVVPGQLKSRPTTGPDREVPKWVSKMVERREKNQGKSRHNKEWRRRSDSSPGDSTWEDFVGKFGSGRRNDPPAPAEPNRATTPPPKRLAWDDFSAQFNSSRREISPILTAEPPKYTGPRFVVDTRGAFQERKSVQLVPGVVFQKRPPGGVPPPDSPGPKAPALWRPSFVPVVGGDYVPGEPAPSGSAPGDSAQGESVPGDSRPGDSVLGDSVQDDSSTR